MSAYGRLCVPPGGHRGTHATATREVLGLHDRRACTVCDVRAEEDMGVHTRLVGVGLDSHECSLPKLRPVT